MSAQGKQPRAPRQTMPCVVGLHHARPRLRSPGLRIAESAQSPERAQQMADQTNTDSQTRTIRDRTHAKQRRNASSIAPRSASRLETAVPVGGDCCALSGLMGLFVSLTQGCAIARKTRGRFPWADMLRPLRVTPLRILGVGFRCTWPFAPRTCAFSRSEKPRTCQPCSVKMLNGVTLRGKETRGSVSRWVLRVLRGHDKEVPNGVAFALFVWRKFAHARYLDFVASVKLALSN